MRNAGSIFILFFFTSFVIAEDFTGLWTYSHECDEQGEVGATYGALCSPTTLKRFCGMCFGYILIKDGNEYIVNKTEKSEGGKCVVQRCGPWGCSEKLDDWRIQASSVKVVGKYLILTSINDERLIMPCN